MSHLRAIGVVMLLIYVSEAIRLDIQRSYLWADGAFLINDDRSVPAVGFEDSCGPILLV